MRRLVDASHVRIPVPVRSRPRWFRRIPTRIAHGIGHDHARVFMDSIGNKAVNPKLAESAPDSAVLRFSGISIRKGDGSVGRCRAPWPVTAGTLRYNSDRARVMPTYASRRSSSTAVSLSLAEASVPRCGPMTTVSNSIPLAGC